jgi:endonuclease/exonuclease/phosphatase family metal-dependent hydrolase
VVEVVRRSGADIVAFQEYGDRTDRALRNAPDLAGWYNARHKSWAIWSRFPLEGDARDTQRKGKALSRNNADRRIGGLITLPDDRKLYVLNTHWWPGADASNDLQSYLLTNAPPVSLAALAENFAARAAAPHAYAPTIERVREAQAAGLPVLVLGDFNEGSHLDYAASGGPDRWVANPTGTPLTMQMRWRGSQEMAALGLKDAWRVGFPDPVVRPGWTWTPPYAAGTPGRRPYADASAGRATQFLDRIDRIYVSPDFKVVSAAVVGECGAFSDVCFDPWPSDHRAVLATLSWAEQQQ